MEETWSSFSICAVAGGPVWPRAVSLPPCTMTKTTFFSKNHKAKAPRSKAEAPAAGTDGEQSSLDHQAQRGRGAVIF